MDFSEVFEFYEDEFKKRAGTYKYVRCKEAKSMFKSFFPNVKYVFVRKSSFDNEKSDVVMKYGIDLCSTNIYIVTNEGKCLSLGSSEWGHLEEVKDTSKFIVEV